MTRRRVSVLCVIGGLDPEYGGTSEAAVATCIATQRAGVDTTLAFAVAPGAAASTEPARRRLAAAGVRVHGFPTISAAEFHARRWGLSPRLATWLPDAVRRYDVVHLHMVWGLAQIAGLAAAAAAGKPVVMTPHESLTAYDVEREHTAIKRTLKALYLREVGTFVMTSGLEARDSLPEAMRDRAVVAPLPILSLDGAAPPARPDAAGRPLRVGFLGRLHEKKNVDVLVEAVAAASPDAHVRIAGDGPEPLKQRLREVTSAAGMTDRVEWLGFVPGSERTAFLASVDVIVMPSEYECFGMAAAEAFAEGVPVVVTSESGVAEIVERHACGLVAEPTVPAVAAALRRLDGDRGLLRALGERGPAAAREELSAEAYGRRLRDVYERAAAGR